MPPSLLSYFKALKDLGSGLMEAAARAVEGAYQEYLRDLAYDAEGSFLEEFLWHPLSGAGRQEWKTP